jgi:hypothetical protein
VNYIQRVQDSGHSEDSNENLRSIKGDEFIGQLSNFQFLRKVFASWT